MDSITYAAILIVVFFVGVFIFSYFETPRRTLKKGMKTLNKGVKQIRNIHVLNVRKTKNSPIILPDKSNTPPKRDDEQDLRIYVHDY